MVVVVVFFPLSLQSCTPPHSTPVIPQPQTKFPSLVATCEKAFTLHRNIKLKRQSSVPIFHSMVVLGC